MQRTQVQNWFSRRRTRAALEQQEKKEKQALLQNLGGKLEKLEKTEIRSASLVSDSSAERKPDGNPRGVSHENDNTLEGILGSSTVAKYSSNNSKAERTLRSSEIGQRISRLSRGGAIVKAEDVKTVCQLMSAASDYEGRKYTLTALLSTKAMVVLEKFVHSNGPAILRTWILDASKNLDKRSSRDTILTSIAILKTLPFDLETLKESKLGRLMKGLSSDRDVDKDISRQASQLVDKWRQLISEARPDSAGSAASVKTDNDKKRTSRDRDGDRQEFFEGADVPLPKFNKAKSTQPVEKIKKTHIAENAGFFKELAAPTRSKRPSSPPPMASKAAVGSTPEPVRPQASISAEVAVSSPTAIVTSPPKPSPSPVEPQPVSSPVIPSNDSVIGSSIESVGSIVTIGATDATAVESTPEIITPMEVTTVMTTETAMDVDESSSDSATEPPKKKKKVVRFKADHELLSIRFIEPRPLPGEVEWNEDEKDEYGSNDLEEDVDMDTAREASSYLGGNPRTFMMPDSMIEALVRGDGWKTPAELQLVIPSRRGSQSTEKDIQEKREMETLSANYLQIAYIPPSPAEPELEPESLDATAPRLIALFEPAADHSNALLNSLTLLQQLAATTNQNVSTANTYLGGYAQPQLQQQQPQQPYQQQSAVTTAVSLAAMYGSTTNAFVQPTQYQQYQQQYQQQQQQPAQQVYAASGAVIPNAEGTQALLNMLQQHALYGGQQQQQNQQQQHQQNYGQNAAAYAYYYQNNQPHSS
ncbi:hypothetical protein BGX28_009101 [Mortierella sp. GBA30]|nr:hypothetical protein BGX28_009101 [Mortierella sp. GBA30]